MFLRAFHRETALASRGLAACLLSFSGMEAKEGRGRNSPDPFFHFFEFLRVWLLRAWP